VVAENRTTTVPARPEHAVPQETRRLIPT
jgi:hypothetical protein